MGNMAKLPRLNITVDQQTMDDLNFLKSLGKESGGSSSYSSAIRKGIALWIDYKVPEVAKLPADDEEGLGI
jgi:hypothetical protein